MYLGIEIGGTKLQLAVGTGNDDHLAAIERRQVDPSRGANGILEQIDSAGAALLSRFNVGAIGIGFGGPVDAAEGRVVKSHQIAGWENAPLRDWCQSTLGRPTTLGNDCDAAALAEARFGAGAGRRIVFFVTVGTGVGGGLVIDDKLHGAGRPPEPQRQRVTHDPGHLLLGRGRGGAGVEERGDEGGHDRGR